MTCPTNTKPAAAAAWAALSPCEKLQHVEHALMELATGKGKTTIRYSDYWVEYAPGSVAFLERERTRLSRLCDAGSRSAISIGRSGGFCR